MDLRLLDIKNKHQYNNLVTHVIQSWEWGEFRESLGLPLLRYGLFKKGKLETAFQLTLHKIPFTNQYVGYLPKGPTPNKDLVQALEEIGRTHSCAFIKVEPDVKVTDSDQVDPGFSPSLKPLFTKYNFVLDLTPAETELLSKMHPKTRYNIKLAKRKGVRVETSSDDAALEIYLDLYFTTTQRQGYHGHSKEYHRKVFKTLRLAGMARLLIASYKQEPLTAWMLLNFKDTLYYPYGGSSNQHREMMASNLVAWEAIKLGKQLRLKRFDMWGALGPDPDTNDPWYGFHKFKQGHGGELVEYIGTYDLVFNQPIYWLFNIIDKFTPLKLLLLNTLSKLKK